MKKIWIIVAVSLVGLLALTGWTLLASSSNSPTEIVQKYWQFCLSRKFDEAKNLKSDSGFQTPISQDTNFGSNSVSTSAAGNTINSDGTAKDCCYLKEIAEQQLKITKVIEEKTKDSNTRVVVEAEDKDKYKKTYVNCLVKLDSKWMITEVAFFDVNDSYTRDLLGIKDYCFPSKSKKQKEQ